MANIRIVFVAILSAFILNACKTPTPGGEPISDNTAQQNSGNQSQQNADNTAQQNSVSSVQRASSPAQQELSTGIASYNNENLKSSRKELLSALRLGLISKHDQALAHKYLAFIDCVSHRKRQCRHEFMEALKVDPAFDLSQAEARHPIWGPIFRTEKAKYAKSVFAHNVH